jgi:hypothetical protein
MRTFFLAALLLISCAPALFAQSFIPTPPPAKDTSKMGFERPYEYERQAYGYDPNGVQYKENQLEDFQVVFISSAPFAALASAGLTGLTSTCVEGKFDLNGPYLIAFIAGTVVGAGAMACISVLSNKYPAPDEDPVLSSSAKPRRLVFAWPILTAQF